MKKVVAFLFLLFSFVMIYAAEPDSTVWASETDNPIDRETCTFKGIPLYGRVKIVTDLADFDVKIEKDLPDLDVEVVDALPNSCGRWEFVDDLPDFTIRFVDDLPDFTIRFVDALPGVR